MGELSMMWEVLDRLDDAHAAFGEAERELRASLRVGERHGSAHTKSAKIAPGWPMLNRPLSEFATEVDRFALASWTLARLGVGLPKAAAVLRGLHREAVSEFDSMRLRFSNRRAEDNGALSMLDDIVAIIVPDLEEDPVMLAERRAIDDLLTTPPAVAEPTTAWREDVRAALAGADTSALLARLAAHRPARAGVESGSSDEIPSIAVAQHQNLMRGIAFAMADAPPERAGVVLAGLALRAFAPMHSYGACSKKLGEACLWALAAMPDGGGAPWLARLGARISHLRTRKRIDATLDRALQATGTISAALEATMLLSERGLSLRVERETIDDLLTTPPSMTEPTVLWCASARAVLAGADVDALLHRLSAHQPDMIHAELARPNWDDTAMWKRYRNLMRGYAFAMAYAPPAKAGSILADLALRCFSNDPGRGIRAERLGNACLWALEAMPAGGGAPYLGRLGARVRYPKVRKRIDAALDRTAETAGMTRADLDEIAVTDHAIGTDDRLCVPVGDGAALIGIEGTRATLGWRTPAGKETKAPAQALKNADPAGIKAAKALAKEIETDLKTQAQRLEGLYLADRRLALADWRARYADHGTVGPLARRLVWIAEAQGEARAFLPLGDGTAIDATGAATTVPEDTTVRLWHPLDAADAEVEAWRTLLMARGVRQPFKQVWRETYRLTDAERRTATYSNRWAGHILRQHQTVKLAQANGWSVTRRMSVDAPNDEPMHVHIPAHDLYAEFWTEGAGGDDPPVTDSRAYLYLSTDRLRFCALEPAVRWSRGEVVALDGVPPIVFSEIMRCGDLFTAVASISADPTWADRGADARHPSQWNREANAYCACSLDADLSASAATRRALIERLLPRLKALKGCAELGERHLFVTGKLNRYRIHLSSGAVALGESGCHVCIVPDSRKADAGAGPIALPFEGDRTLSLILSKALLLARDDRVRDPIIVHQIN